MTKEQNIIDEINKGITYSSGNRVWKAIGDLEELKKAEEQKRILEIIDEQTKTMDSFYDNGYYIGINTEFIKELPTKGEMIEARLHALSLLTKEIKSEDKKE